MKIRAGTATVSFTPPEGAIIAAFPRPPNRTPRRAKGALDPLQARAVALDDGETRVLLCSVDLCVVREESVRRIRDRVCERTSGVDPENVLIAATHTHSGAETSFLFGGHPDDEGLAQIEMRIADALVQAAENLEPVEMSYGTVSLDRTHNRRVTNGEGRSVMVHERTEETTGPVDPQLTALQFTRPSGDIKAVLFHYTAHPLTLGPGNDFFSADYPGKARRVVEDALSAETAVFLNGAAGNVHPWQCMRADTEALETVGEAVGAAAVEAVRNAVPVESRPLRLETERLTFPNRADPSRVVQVEIGVMQLGPMLFGLVPGEFFVEFQLRFKEELAPIPATLIGYANGWPGYAPTKESYAEGGYGVDLAAKDPARYSRTALPQGAGEAIIERLVACARTIRGT